jgi:integrase
MRMTEACVYKREDSPYWWVKYWSPERLRWHQKSTGFRSDDSQGYKRALTMARDLSAEGRIARQVAPTSRWPSWVPQWLRTKHHDSPNTLESELGRWRWLDAFLTERKIHGPQGMTYLLGLDYMTWRTSQTKRISKKHPGHNTALMELRLLSRALQEAVHRGYIYANPLARINIKRHRPPEKPELTDADIAAIRAALAEREGHLPLQDRWMTICFEIALHQGCRVSETSILLSDIDENAGRITFHAKGHKVFTTLLNPALIPLIRQLRAAGARQTCNLPKMVTKEWHWFLKGRPERGWKGVCPHVCFHCTRVTAITRMARNNVPIQKAMRFVNHADETVHRIYQRLQADDLDLCVEALRFFPTNGKPQTPDAGATTPLAKHAS